jgi:hypothetical protein
MAALLSAASNPSKTTGRRLATLMAVVLVAALAACQPQIQLEPTARPAASGASIVVVSEIGQVPTKPAPRTPSPSPTTDIILQIHTVVAFPTRSPAPPGTPSPTIGPPPTSSPRPSPTRMIMSGPPVIATPTPRPPPTRTPRETVDPVDIEETRIASLPPSLATPEPDGFEPNDTPQQAEVLAIEDRIEDLTLHDSRDVDVFQIPVDEADMTLVVSLSGSTLGRYSLSLSSPTRGSAGRVRYDGTVTMRAVADIGSDTGIYYATVRTVGAVPPQGPYSIAATLVASAPTPTVVP